VKGLDDQHGIFLFIEMATGEKILLDVRLLFVRE
jgi:hypothetical protein